MEHDEPVPEADALEQEEPVTADAGEPRPGPAGAVPEADALEQAQVVDAAQTRVPAARRDDAPEADWLEQTIVEPVDDEER